MAKVTRQSSGVVGGAVDVSRRTTVKSPQTPAASALARRKQAGLRGKKAVAQTKSAPRRVTKKKAPSRRR